MSLETFSVFLIKIPSSESRDSLTDSIYIYGTTTKNGTHLFCCLFRDAFILDLLCCVTWIIFNYCLHLLIINDCSPGGMSSVFQIKIFTLGPRELFMNRILSYGTISVNGTYLFFFLYPIFYFPERKEYQIFLYIPF